MRSLLAKSRLIAPVWLPESDFSHVVVMINVVVFFSVKITFSFDKSARVC